MNKLPKYLFVLLCSVLLVGNASHTWAQQTEEVQVETDNAASAASSDEAKQSSSARSSNIVLETTSVTGSRELPKVLVIVPWKTSEALGPGERPLASLVEEALSPLDPDEFRREINYYTELNDSSNKPSGSANTSRKVKPQDTAAPE